MKILKSIKSILTNNFPNRTVLSVIVIASIDMLSMFVPWYLKYSIPGVYSYLGINQSQYDKLIFIMGVIMILTILPSGWLADRFSSRRMLIVSVLLSSFGIFLFGICAQFLKSNSSKYPLFIFIFVIFGFSTSLFLWSQMWKVLVKQGKKQDEAKLYSLHHFYNAILGILIIGILGICASLMIKTKPGLFYSLFYISSFGLFLCSLGLLFLIKETYKLSPLIYKIFFFIFNKKKYKELIEKDDLVKAKYLKSFKEYVHFMVKPLKTFRIWLIGFFILGCYMYQSVFNYYLNNMLLYFHKGETGDLKGTDDFFIKPRMLITILSVFKIVGLRIFICNGFGKWINKKKSFILSLAIILWCAIILGLIFSFLPDFVPSMKKSTYFNSHNKEIYKQHFKDFQNNKNFKIISYVMCVFIILISSLSWCLVVGRYITVQEIPVSKKSYGITIGILSIIGFSSDAWIFSIGKGIMKSTTKISNSEMEVIQSYDLHTTQIILWIASGIALLGLFSALLCFYINRKELKKLNKKSYRWRRLEI